MREYYGFLHDHPRKQAEIKIDDKHVIVDKCDWYTLRKVLYDGYLPSYRGFLHGHPFSHSLDDQHVIVDKEDWENVRIHCADSSLSLQELLHTFLKKYRNAPKNEKIDHPVTKSYRSSKKIKKNDIIDFKIYWLISILHYVISYTLWMLLGIRFKSLSISKDPIKYFAGVVFNKSEKSITMIERETAKLILFKSIFGKN